MTTTKNRGKGLEKQLEALHVRYEVDGRAWIRKEPTDWGVVFRDGKRQAFPKTKAGVDFVGNIAGGRAIYFDAKETKVATRFNFDNVHDHQIDFVQARERSGALAFFLVYFVPHNRYFIVTADQILAARAAGRASLKLAELEQGLEVPVINGFPDYLLPLLRAEGRTA